MPISIAQLLIEKKKLSPTLYQYTFTIIEESASTPGKPHRYTSRMELESSLEFAATERRNPKNLDNKYFTDLGEQLYKDYVPADIQQFLYSSRDPLLITTNAQELPWELIRNPAITGSGIIRQGDEIRVPSDQFLGIYRPVGRMPREGMPPEAHTWTQSHDGLFLLSERAIPHLSGAFSQIEAILTPQMYTPHLQQDFTIERLQSLLDLNWEFFLYLGHAIHRVIPSEERYLIQVPENERNKPLTGFLLKDGKLLNVTSLQGLQGHFGWVFLGACAGGRIVYITDPEDEEQQKEKLSREGLAQIFLQRGASVVVGPLWPVFAEGVSVLSEAFFDQVKQGIPFGEALRAVRAEFRKNRYDDPTWASFVLYGDPRHTWESVRNPGLLGQTHYVAARGVNVAVQPSMIDAQARADKHVATLPSSRGEIFFRRFVTDEQVHLSQGASQGIQHALEWLDEVDHRFMARMDLLVGLAMVSGGMLERGLSAIGKTVKDLQELNLTMFKKGKGATEQPAVSDGVGGVITSAERKVRQELRQEITEDDLLALLLPPVPSGSIKLALENLKCDAVILLAAARGQPVPNE